jgi:hypothetical protein
MIFVRLARVAIASAVIGAAAPRVLASQSRDELPARLQPVTRATIERLADSLAHESLPVEPLYDKAAEGVLKGADDARIVAAIRGLAQRLREARVLLGPAATDAELAAASSALHAGAAPALIRGLVTTRDDRLPGRSLGLPLVVLANLIADGVPASVASESLTTLMVHGARDDELSAFRWSVARDIQGGTTPAAAASGVMARLRRTTGTGARQP